MANTFTAPVPTRTLLLGLVADPDTAGHAAAALMGDEVARDNAIPDHLEERGFMVPFAVGEKHLIQTETLYWVGEIVEVCGGFLVLHDASWVHWTGRLSVLCKNKSFVNKKWSGQRPRTEYVGRVIVSLSKIVNSIPGEWELPTESIQT